jgi:tRNA 2-thiouridine synthesizing protein A
MTPPMSEPLVIDARGHRCPVPSLRLRRALETAPEHEIVHLLSDDPLARIDVPHLVAALGHEMIGMEPDGTGWRFTVRARRPA